MCESLFSPCVSPRGIHAEVKLHNPLARNSESALTILSTSDHMYPSEWYRQEPKLTDSSPHCQSCPRGVRSMPRGGIVSSRCLDRVKNRSSSAYCRIPRLFLDDARAEYLKNHNWAKNWRSDMGQKPIFSAFHTEDVYAYCICSYHDTHICNMHYKVICIAKSDKIRVFYIAELSSNM